MTVSERKQILRMVPYGLYVVTCRHEGEANAFTGSWMTQCSFKPPLLALAVNREHRSYQMIRSSGAFGVNFLRRDQQAIARHFIRSWDVLEEKFGGVVHEPSPSGIPILADALAYLECRVRDCCDQGDHALFIGEVVDGRLLREGEPLTMSDTRWHYAG